MSTFPATTDTLEIAPFFCWRVRVSVQLPCCVRLSNNHKTWFDANRPRYERIRADFVNFVEQLLPPLSTLDDPLEGLEVKNCIFRINRDVRFSPNKEPYKNHLGAYFAKGGKQSPQAGYYLHLQPQASFLAVGLWQPEKEILQAIRQEIDYNSEHLRKVLRVR